MVAVAYPWVLWATALAAGGVIAAHLLSVVTPPRLALPTARFVPNRVSRAVSRSAVPTDRWLLALRLLALALFGAALAGFSWRGARLPVVTLVVVEPPYGVAGSADTAADTAADTGADSAADTGADSAADTGADSAADTAADSRADRGAKSVADSAAWRDALRSAAARFAPISGVALGTRVVIDEALPANLLDTLTPTADSLTLAARLLVARRAVGPLTQLADSVRLVVVSAMRDDATGAALDAVRATWPGRIEVVRVPVRVPDADMLDGASGPLAAATVVVLGGADSDAPDSRADRARDAAKAADAEDAALPADDIVAAAFARWTVPGADSVRVRRDRLGAPLRTADSAFAARGGVLLRWPIAPSDSTASGSADSLRYAVATQGAALVAPMRWLGSLESAGNGASGIPIVWWSNGDVAARESAVGDGCVREVAFAAPAGDALLGAAAVPVLRALAAPCEPQRTDVARALAPVLDSARLAAFADSGALAVASALPSSRTDPLSPFTRPLLLAALVVLLAELFVRRSQGNAVHKQNVANNAPPAVAT